MEDRLIEQARAKKITARQRGVWHGQKWCRNSTRLAIYLRDGLACVYCGAAVEDGTQLTLDHIVCSSQGGSNDPSNLVTACHRCNTARGNRSIAAFIKAAASYLNANPKNIVASIRRTVKQPLPRSEAKALLARRTFSQALASVCKNSFSTPEYKRVYLYRRHQ